MSGLLSFSRPSDAPGCGGTTCVYPPVCGHLGCLHLSAHVAPCTALMWTRVLVSLWRTPSLGAAGSNGNSGYPSEETPPCSHSAAPVPLPHPHRGVGVALTMISRCVSLMVSEHLLPVGHLCFLFGEMSVQILCLFSFFFPSFFLLKVFFFFDVDYFKVFLEFVAT